MAETDAATLTVCMLGTFEVFSQGKPISPKTWGRKKTKDLLKILLSERGRSFTVDQLIDLLYPETEPDKVVKNLRGRVSQLRRALEPTLTRGSNSQYVQNVGQGYRFNEQAPCWLDTNVFVTRLKQAQQLVQTDRWAQALDQYERALALYRGDFLAEDRYEEWTLSFRDQYRQDFLSALEGAARCHAQLGDTTSALACCQRALAHEAHRESAYRLKMRFCYHAGQQQRALETYAACVHALKDLLGVEPTLETRKLYLQIERQQVPEFQRTVPHNLPTPLTKFVGRTDELAVIRQHLDDPHCRLLTLIGPGGIGKTRLAIQAAHERLEAFEHGVYWVSLAGAFCSAEELTSTIAEALRFTFYGKALPQSQLADYLREKSALLVLDNFEHLAPHSALLNDLLSQAPGVKCLVTSRVRLDLQGEWTVVVGGLPVADETAEGGSTSDAVRLFTSSVMRLQPGFTMGSSTRGDVIELCRLVEGSPLGIELAAAWMPSLSCADLVDEVRSSLDFLTAQFQDIPERHRSLRATFESSWALLSEEERRVAAKLSVFRGGFSREAADQVAGTSLRRLAALANKSFLKRSGGQRYEMHGLLRQFAAEKLGDETVVEASIKVEHSRYFTRLLHHQESLLKGAGQKQALQTIALELDNVRLAWNQAVEQGQWDQLGRALESLFLFYEMKGRLLEGEQVFHNAIAALSQRRRSKRQQQALAELRTRLGRLLYNQGKLDRAGELFEQSLFGFEHHPGPGKAFAWLNLGIVYDNWGKYDEAKPYFEQSLSLYRAQQDAYGQAYVYLNQGVLAFDEGDYGLAERCYEKGLNLFRPLQDRFGLAKALNNLGNLHFVREAYAKAKPYYEECLEKFQYLDIRWGMNIVLNNLGGLANALGAFDEARKWHLQSMALSQEIGDRTGLAMSMSNLGEVCVNQGHIEEAKRHFSEALTVAQHTQTAWILWDVLLYLTQLGLKEKQTDWALKALVFFAEQHPLRYMREEAQQSLAALGQQLPAQQLAEAKAQAGRLQVDTVLADARQWLGLDTCSH